MCVHDRAGDCLDNTDAKITLRFQVLKKIELLFQELFKKIWTVCWYVSRIVQNKLWKLNALWSIF